MGDAESVVTFLPGTAQQQPRNALFFRRSDLAPQLTHPLRATLDQSRSPVAAAHARAEAREVARLTGPRLFRFQIAQTQGGAGILMLSP